MSCAEARIMCSGNVDMAMDVAMKVSGTNFLKGTKK